MAVTHVDGTHNLHQAVDYTVKGKPHHDNKYIQGKRALGLNAINASPNPTAFKREASLFLRHDPLNRKGTYTGIRTIISFDPKQLDYRKLSDRHTALNIGTEIAKRKFPHNQSLIVLQADGKNHRLHDHIITCARRLDNGLSSTHNATFKNIVPITNAVERDYGYRPIPTKDYQHKAPTSHVIYGLQRKGKYSYVQDLHNRIVDSYKNATTINQFLDNLNRNHIGTKPLAKLRKNKQTGEYEYHFYKHPTKKGNYQKVTNDLVKQCYQHDSTIARNSHIAEHLNQYLRLKKHATYVFKDKYGKNRTIRTKKLGKDTDLGTIIHTINRNNINQQRGIKQKEQIPSSSSISSVNNHQNNSRAVSNNKFKYTLADLQPKRKVLTCHKYSVTETNDKVYKYDKDDKKYIGYPCLSLHNTGEYKQPVMTFHPKTHDISKALNEVISGLNRIAKATQAGSAERQRQLNIFYSQCEFKKEEAKKIEANEENKEAFYKVQSDNQAIAEQCAEANRDYERILKYNQAHYQGPTLF